MSFDAIIGEDANPVLVDFWAPWCKPCHALTPILEEVEAAQSGRFRLVKVNAEDCTKLAERFNVRSLPTLVLLSGGETVSRKVGAVSRPALEDWVAAALA
jgi:thioredoxin